MLGQRYDELFDIFFKDLFNTNSYYLPLSEVKRINYPVDIYEDKENIYFEIAAVGMDKEDVHVKVKDNTLTISYNKEDEKDIEYIYKGITNKSFNQSYKLNPRFNLDKIDAKLEKGKLVIKVPVLEERKDREIKIG